MNKKSKENVSSVQEKFKTAWTNKDNINFFENISLKIFGSWPEKGGFDKGCDLDLILEELKSANSILEVGASYGRVIQYLVDKNLKANITAVERSHQFFEQLYQKFENKIRIIEADINNVNFDEKFDVILCLWSTISDFAKDEQLAMLKHISSWLKKGSKLVIDVMTSSFTRENVTEVSSQDYVVKYDDATLLGYIPSEKELTKYANQLEFEVVKFIPYTTETDRKRLLAVFTK